MRKIKVLAICAIAALSITSVKAQFATGADIVSSYVWRGFPQEATKGTPNIQPYVSFTTGGLTLGSWASSSLLGNVKEVDLYATYAFSSQFAVTLTDYNWGFASAKGYFDYTATTDHIYEATVAYTGTEKLPISASINTMFAGADKNASGKQALSTYIELGYQLSPIAKVFAGGLVSSGTAYGSTATGITNVGIKVSKSIAITEKFSLPVYGVLGANPSTGGAFFVAGVTL
ncbi:MAG: hypothetical protein PHR83_01855 [Paludibacter sp.]|nr:hypothetical protein [Paludibacter sp.]